MPDIQAKAIGTQKLGIKVAAHGGRFLQTTTYVADWSPYCDDPVRLERRITSRLSTSGKKMHRLILLDPIRSMEVAGLVPCRKCPKCLQFRQMKWRERAITETTLANRTWFVTLTFSPIHLAGILMEAKGQSLRQTEMAAYRHVQLFFKRLRKAKAIFRYLAIYERGEKTGRSHYHLFLHEHGDKPIMKQQIEDQWTSFVHARLVSDDGADGAASYLTKYITKSFSIRPRASALYGKSPFPPKL